MASLLTNEELTALGLERDHIGAHECLSLGGEDHVARGFSRVEAFSFDQAVERGWPVPLRSPIADGLGFEIARFAERPTTLCITPPSSDIVVKRIDDDGLDGMPSVVGTAPDEIFIDLEQLTTPVLLVNRRGEGILVKKRAREVDVWQVGSAGNAAMLATDLSADILRWKAELSDKWLVEFLDHKLALGGLWQQFVAVGALVRLRRRTWERERELVEQLLAGERPAELDLERCWARQLSGVVVEQIEALLKAKLRELHKRLEQLAREWEGGVILSTKEVLDALYTRDDIESVRLLLGEAGALEKYDKLISAIDTRGAKFVDAISAEFRLYDDLWLRRAVLSNPEGWWVQLAAEDA